MTYGEFEQVFEATVEKSRDMLGTKNIEYARGGDKLSNFKKAAHLQSCTQEKALQGMLAKHLVSVNDYINDHEDGQPHTLSQWDEKIMDCINYLILLRAMLVEDTARYELKAPSKVNLCATCKLYNSCRVKSPIVTECTAYESGLAE